MSILIVGGAGYIGSQTAKRVAQAGLEPVVFDNLVYGHKWAVKWGPFVEGDLADGALVRRVLAEHKVTAVIHFAAYAYVGESVQNPRKYFHNNVVNTLNLLDAMVDGGVRDIVFSSTCAVYGEPQRVPISEDNRREPVNPYGDSKLAVEKILRWYGGAYNLRYAALRYFNAAGADPDGELGRLRRDFARSDLRTSVRPGHADSVDAALHRERRQGRWLRVRLLVRVHGHDQLGVSDRAASDDP